MRVIRNLSLIHNVENILYTQISFTTSNCWPLWDWNNCISDTQPRIKHKITTYIPNLRIHKTKQPTQFTDTSIISKQPLNPTDPPYPHEPPPTTVPISRTTPASNRRHNHGYILDSVYFLWITFAKSFNMWVYIYI